MRTFALWRKASVRTFAQTVEKSKYAHMATHPSSAAVMNSLGRGGVRHASIARQNPLSSAIYPFLSNLSFQIITISQGVDRQAFLGNTNLLWHFTIFTHFYPTYRSIAKQCPLSLTLLLGFARFCHSPDLLEMGGVGYANLTSKTFSLLDHLASAMIV